MLNDKLTIKIFHAIVIAMKALATQADANATVAAFKNCDDLLVEADAPGDFFNRSVLT